MSEQMRPMTLDGRMQQRDNGQGGSAGVPLVSGKTSLAIDVDLHSVTEKAMKKARSKKGKKKAHEGEWVFGPPLQVREGMFAGKVLR
jgi:hypothetical protein